MKELKKEAFISEMEKIIEKNDAKKPYDINIIDELHANENAHTRLLIQLLKYSNNGEFFILNKFIKLLNQEGNPSPRIPEIQNPGIWDQWEKIDGLICSRNVENNTAIIIENKINWAEDQKKQIERYIESVNKIAKIKNENIYVIYLTDNGTKEVSDISLTKEAKKFLGITDECSGRYIKLNYKDNLLPFFKEILSFLEFSKEVFLKSTLIQYIDYLEGRFGLREREKEYNTSIINDMLNMLDIKLSGLTLKEKATLYSILISYRNKKLKFNTEQQNKYNSFYEKLCETVYPQNERPGTVKNNFYHYFVKHPEENMDKLPFKNPFINFNSYPNVIHLEEPETMIKFPDDELSEESITIYSRKSFDGWKKDGDFYTNKIPYVDNYKKEPEEFFNYIYNMVTK